MASLFTRMSVVGTVAVIAGVVSLAGAQAGRVGRLGASMYDAKTEVTITGTVEAVDTLAGPAARGRRGMGGTHLMVKTASETLEVHLGPTAYLTEKQITLAKGDELEIVGSRVTMGSGPVILARQIKKGEATWTLRDESGRPLWSGRR